MRPGPLTPQVRRLARRWQKRRVAVLMGGTSAERPISLLSGLGVVAALRRAGLKPRPVDVKSVRTLFGLTARRPDVAVLCLHGPGGEDGKVQGVLEWLGIPYTGSGVLASALAMDKARAKQIFQTSGLPTAPWALLPWNEKRFPRALSLPVVVKPNAQGSAIGVTMVKHLGQWPRALAAARRFGREVLVERFLPGRELSVAVLGGRALPVIEIVPRNEFYDFEAKYKPGMSQHIIPARIPAAWQREAQRLSVAACAALGCTGSPRVDLIVGPTGKMNLLEVNTLPGMTATSLLPDAAAKAGICFEALVLQLMQDAQGAKA